MFVFCARCGHIEKKTVGVMCPVCENSMKDVPDKYLSSSGNLFLSQEVREQFIEEVIASGKDYDVDLAKRHNAILKENKQKHTEMIADKVRQYNSTKVVLRCPVCGSTNLSAISTVGKVVKISLIGVWGAGDLGKKRHCNSCGHKF